MAIAALKIKIMPESPEVDLEAIKKKVEEIASGLNVKIHSYDIQPVAFGLKSLEVLFAWPEEMEQEKIEAPLREIEHVESVEVTDFRRAIG
ncbi:MAG: elongation factor 1-beta [archaeon]|nr:MAG: elongation factor 1-beta [archaeon]